MGLLGDIYSAIDTKKRQVKGLLDDFGGTVDMGVRRFREDQQGLQNLFANAYPMAGDKTVLNSPQQIAQFQGEAGDAAANMGLAGIVSPKVAAGLNTVKNLPNDDLFRQAVANTPGASVGDDGLRMMIQRNQMPEQSMSPSVRGGVFYLPEGAAQGKHYSTGKSGYGGNEKIVGETLIQNPLFVKGATGGKAPEAAYDQLLGKGAYQTMRTDALKAYGTYGSSVSQKAASVRSFLDKYAPELSDEADYIVNNSKQGNQLAYALQEAAAGSAVRKAGHDVVLGHSKGKSGPFLSEVFDLRERSYPNKFGGSDVWDSFMERNGQPVGGLLDDAKPFVYPQGKALETAQRNAAKPISEGGLGLPANNTAMDRAKAMGFDTDVYHGTPDDAIARTRQFKDSMLGKTTQVSDAKLGHFTTDNGSAASEYIWRGGSTDGGNVLPLKLAGNRGTARLPGEWQPGRFDDSLMNAKANNLDGLNIEGTTTLGKPGNYQVTFAPKNIRSRFAAFDPARRNESDILGRASPELLKLLAASTAGGLLGYNALKD